MTKDPPSVLETLGSLAVGVTAFGALLVGRWLLDLHYQRTRSHPPRCICRRHRRRDPKVAGLGKRRRRA